MIEMKSPPPGPEFALEPVIEIESPVIIVVTLGTLREISVDDLKHVIYVSNQITVFEISIDINTCYSAGTYILSMYLIYMSLVTHVSDFNQ